LGQSSYNQCLFVRYLDIKLRERALPGSGGPTEVKIEMRSHQSTSPGAMQSNSTNLGPLRTFGSALWRKTASTPRQRLLGFLIFALTKHTLAYLDQMRGSLRQVSEQTHLSIRPLKTSGMERCNGRQRLHHGENHHSPSNGYWTISWRGRSGKTESRARGAICWLWGGKGFERLVVEDPRACCGN